MLRDKRSTIAFALYEVMIGLAIFMLGVLALGRAVENCLNANTLNAEEERVRQILSNSMAEIQATPRGGMKQSRQLQFYVYRAGAG